MANLLQKNLSKPESSGLIRMLKEYFPDRVQQLEPKINVLLPQLNQECITDQELKNLVLQVRIVVYDLVQSHNLVIRLVLQDILIVNQILQDVTGRYPINRIECLLDKTDDELDIFLAEKEMTESDFLVLNDNLFNHLPVFWNIYAPLPVHEKFQCSPG